MASLRPCLQCSREGRNTWVRGSRCPEHQGTAWARRPDRPDLHTAAWTALSKRRRKAYPMCEVPGCRRPSTSTDHIIRPADGGTNAWGNLRAICTEHHAQKSSRQGHAAQARKRRRS